jgi:signal transduction histidine kinase
MLTEEIPQTKAAPEKAVVLVVDDEYGPRESVAFTLSSDYTVETSDRAAEALARIRKREYSAVVMDIRMPEMDGIHALEELRKIDPLVSVIMLTGYGTLMTAQQAMIGGANQYLRKPPDVDELLAAVKRQVEATKVRRHQAKLARDAEQLNLALKKELESKDPQVWHGQASVELVHDLNNPLTVVIGYSTLLAEEARGLSQRDPELGKKLSEYAHMVESAAEYCHHLSENWRLSSRKIKEFAKVDLVQASRDVQQVIFFGNTAIQITGIAEAWVLGSKFELMRIFQNLFKNGIEAGATNVVATFEQKGKALEVSIADNGAGMDPESVRKAMHGGFTSKAAGTGLGLSICRHLVGAHGGTFDLKSQIGHGTTITLSFPAA